MKIGNQDILGIYLGNQSVRAYLGSQLILPTITISGTWDPSLTDKNKKVIISGEVTLTGKTDCYSLTFEQGGHLTIEAGARLRVWEGGITNDDCTTVNYFTIVEDANNLSFGELLIHPSVNTNVYFLLNVEHTTIPIGKDSNNEYQWERFNIATQNLTSWTKVPNYGIQMYIWSYQQDSWIMAPNGIHDLVPFEGNLFTLGDNVSALRTSLKITMPGMSNGNIDKTLTFQRNGYHIHGNGYLARIKTSAMFEYLSSKGISLDINVNRFGNSNFIQITQENISSYPYIYPMESYITKKNGTDYTLSYKDLVWDPSFEEEVTPTRGLMKGALTSPKPAEIDTTLEGSGIFDNPESPFPPEPIDEK